MGSSLKGGQIVTGATYHSFLLRIWRERSLNHPDNVAAEWQGEIESIQTGERWTFESLDEMLVFLHQQAEGPEAPAQGSDG